MTEGQRTPAMPTPAQSTEQLPLRPHRGGIVLALGIIGVALALPGLLCCAILPIPACICGIIAWVMGNSDLRDMAAGRMDPAGRGLTQAGKICGMIGAIIAIVAFCITLLCIAFAILAGATAR